MHYHKTAFRSTLTQVFTKAAYIAFNTTAEQKLARKIFGMHMAPHSIVSVGIELSAPSDWAVTQEKYNLPDEYMLYVGRVEPRTNLTMCILISSTIKRYILILI